MGGVGHSVPEGASDYFGRKEGRKTGRQKVQKKRERECVCVKGQKTGL